MAASDRTPSPVNPLQARWHAGETIYGVLVTMPSVPRMHALGGVALSPPQAKEMAERGYRALALGFDWTLVQRGAAAVLEGLRP